MDEKIECNCNGGLEVSFLRSATAYCTFPGNIGLTVVVQNTPKFHIDTLANHGLSLIGRGIMNSKRSIKFVHHVWTLPHTPPVHWEFGMPPRPKLVCLKKFAGHFSTNHEAKVE